MSAAVQPGDVVWRPSPTLLAECNMTRYLEWLREERKLDLDGYRELWSWSVDRLDQFWESIWDFERVSGARGEGPALAEAEMPGASWFPGASVNFAEHLLRAGGEWPALIAVHQDEDPVAWSWERVRRDAGALAGTLTELGVGRGDRVVAYLPNVPEAVVGLIACASIGAVWSICAPDFGVTGVASRFAQLEPKVLIAVDGYRFAGREYPRGEEVRRLVEGIDSAPHLIWVDRLAAGAPPRGLRATSWTQAVAGAAELRFEQLPFDHPLWVLFSSGTTGVPKGIVHGHGGILLEHLKQVNLQTDVRRGDRLLFVGSTSWMVWNMLVSNMLVGATPVLLDGSPVYPDVAQVWRTAAKVGATSLGVGAGYIGASMKAGLRPAAENDLSALRALVSTGSPLPVAGFAWVREQVGEGVWLSSASGGTDVCSSFLGSCPLLPVRAGRLQAPQLGVAVEAWSEEAEPLIGATGELVVTRPMPSMPLRFWNDADGERYRSSYFDTFPGAWRHGDFVEIFEDGSSVIHGRSDSTLNRKGVRMGSAEFYAVLEPLPEVEEALVIGTEVGEDDYYMPLFVVLAPGVEAEQARTRIVAAIRESLTPRHVPDEIVIVPGVPHTRTGKKLEIPVKRLLQGTAAAEAFDRGAVDDPDLIDFYAELARKPLGKLSQGA